MMDTVTTSTTSTFTTGTTNLVLNSFPGRQDMEVLPAPPCPASFSVYF